MVSSAWTAVFLSQHSAALHGAADAIELHLSVSTAALVACCNDRLHPQAVQSSHRYCCYRCWHSDFSMLVQEKDSFSLQHTELRYTQLRNGACAPTFVCSS